MCMKIFLLIDTSFISAMTLKKAKIVFFKKTKLDDFIKKVFVFDCK